MISMAPMFIGFVELVGGPPRREDMVMTRGDRLEDGEVLYICVQNRLMLRSPV